ncbi:major facilitator superfamily transporter [Hypoxylon rubiginosum]|uniref:Major facilitator superfamily transporter n=1 Tax=Hypoxylon rubiginosum TaxID=110542 RepID=A0ACC0D1X3_9PEZI|nr:major facilitator superfamily transporter [Hypoxylon rubiginosum]
MSSHSPSTDEEKAVARANESDEVLGGASSGDDAAPVAAPASERQIRGFQWALIICSILSSMFIYALDGTITADLIPAIVNQFGSVSKLPWLSVGFMAGAFVAILPVGKLYAKYNAKWVYTISVVIFLAASALCGAAPNMDAIIVGRVFLGVSGSAMYCGILTLVAVNTVDHERPAYISLCGLVWGVGTVIGPVIGGAFQKVDWRWAFYINLIIGGIFIPAYLFVLPSFDPMPKSVSLTARAKNFDFLGSILFIASNLCLILAMNFGGNLYPWGSGSIITFFVVGGVGLIAFCVQQRYSWLTTPVDRIFPAQLLRIKEANLLFLCTVCTNAAVFIPIFNIPVYFQFSRNEDALNAAVRLLPLIVLASAGMLFNGFLMVKFGYYWPWYTVGGAMALVGNVLLYMIDATTPAANIYGYEILVGLGIGICNQAGYGVVHALVAPEDKGNAVPFMMTAQYSGITLGLSIAGAVFLNYAMIDLRALLPGYPDDQLNAIISGTSGSAFETVPVELRGAVVDIIVDSLRKVFIPSFVGAAGAFVLSFFLNKKRFFHKGDEVPVHMG